MDHSKYSTTRGSVIALSLVLAGVMVSGCGSSDSNDNAAQELEIGAATDAATDADTDTIIIEIDTASTVGLAECEILAGSGNVESIAGLYDDTQGGDISYLHISNEGTTTVYDYQQDDVDQGENCFAVRSGDSAVSELSDNRYLSVTYFDSDLLCQTETQILTINRSDNVLSISYTDTKDQDGDGDLGETVTDTYPALAGLSVESFINCE